VNRKVQLKPTKVEETVAENGETATEVKEILVIVKWGGDLTSLGSAQSEHLGTEFRKNMYPGQKVVVCYDYTRHIAMT